MHAPPILNRVTSASTAPFNYKDSMVMGSADISISSTMEVEAFLEIAGKIETTQYNAGCDNNSPSTAKLTCVCSWKHCGKFQQAFRQAKYGIYDGYINIVILDGEQSGIDYKSCLDRTLAVSNNKPEWNVNAMNVRYCTYNVARHHFTRSHLEIYESNPTSYSFVNPLTLKDAHKSFFLKLRKKTR